MKLQQLYHEFKNYEGLTTDEQSKVPETSYKNAEAYLEITKNNSEEREAKKKNK